MKTTDSICTLALSSIVLVVGSTLSAYAAPVLEFLFRETSGSIAANTGTLGSSYNGQVDGPMWSSDHPPLGSGASIQFDGADDFVSIPPITYGGQVTVEAWVKPSDTTRNHAIWDDYGGPGVYLGIVGGHVYFVVSTTNNPSSTADLLAGDVTLNVWQHVAGVYDGQALRVYVNAIDSGQTTQTSGTIHQIPGGHGAIGADNNGPRNVPFQGNIADFRIHLSALRPDELARGVFALCPLASIRTSEVEVCWQSKSNAIYRVDYRSDLTANNWVQLFTNILGSGDSMCVADKIPRGQPQRFYRVACPIQ